MVLAESVEVADLAGEAGAGGAQVAPRPHQQIACLAQAARRFGRREAGNGIRHKAAKAQSGVLRGRKIAARYGIAQHLGFRIGYQPIILRFAR
jgi:hypothetical protein